MDHIIGLSLSRNRPVVCFVKCLILPESQKATCTGFNASELEYSRLLYI